LDNNKSNAVNYKNLSHQKIIKKINYLLKLLVIFIVKIKIFVNFDLDNY